MNLRKSLLAAMTALTLGYGALNAQAAPTGVPIVLDPEVAALACASLCNLVRVNAERACEADVRSDGEATMEELFACLLEGFRAQNACRDKFCG
jgi:hypothetical protein